jgi:hypothetical protein
MSPSGSKWGGVPPRLGGLAGFGPRASIGNVPGLAGPSGRLEPRRNPARGGAGRGTAS